MYADSSEQEEKIYISFLATENSEILKETEEGDEINKIDVFVCENSEKSETQMRNIVHETLSSVLVDSGCTKNVVGRNWVDNYRETLSTAEQKIMTPKTCGTKIIYIRRRKGGNIRRDGDDSW